MQHHLQNSNAFYLFWLEIGMPGKIGRLLTGELLQHDSLMMWDIQKHILFDEKFGKEKIMKVNELPEITSLKSLAPSQEKLRDRCARSPLSEYSPKKLTGKWKNIPATLHFYRPFSTLIDEEVNLSNDTSGFASIES